MGKRPGPVSWEIYNEHHNYFYEFLNKMDFCLEGISVTLDHSEHDSWGINLMMDMVADAQKKNDEFFGRATSELKAKQDAESTA